MIRENETYNFSLEEAKRLSIPVFCLDTRDENIVTAFGNDAILEAYQLSESTFIEQALQDIFPNKDYALLLESRFRDVIKNKKPFSQIESIRLNNNKIYCVLHSEFPLLNQNNQAVGIYGFSIPLMENNSSCFLDGVTNTQVGQSYNLLQALQISQEHMVYFHPFLAKLTIREKECLNYVLKGHSAKIIARHLNISYRTVEIHLQNIKEKLGVHSKQALLELCRNELN